jgi:hypothetical protein
MDHIVVGGYTTHPRRIRHIRLNMLDWPSKHPDRIQFRKARNERHSNPLKTGSATHKRAALNLENAT